jgi:hypothetical protein
MKRLREPKWLLIFVFVGILAAVPLAQTFMEFGADEGVLALDLFSGWPTSERLRSFEHKLEGANWVARISRPWLQYADFALKEGGEKVVVGSDGWYFFKPGLKYMLARPEGNLIAGGTNDAVAAIVDFRNQLEARGVHLLVVPVPNKESIYPDRLKAPVKTTPGMVTPRTREVLEKLRAHGVETVDLFKEFNEARQQGHDAQAPLYLAQDTHWSPAGVELAAKLVSRRLVELGWIEPGKVEYREKPAPVQRVGDILRMLQTPKIEQSIAPESVAAMQVLRADNAKPYVDEASAQALILGDSFTRIYQTDTPTSAGFISHLAKELKQPLMSIVNDGGGSTLVREELCARPVFLDKKKVVVWEFVERDIGIGVKGWRRTPLPPVR